MKTNCLQADLLTGGTNTPSVTLEDNLQRLRLGYLLENARSEVSGPLATKPLT